MTMWLSAFGLDSVLFMIGHRLYSSLWIGNIVVQTTFEIECNMEIRFVTYRDIQNKGTHLFSS